MLIEQRLQVFRRIRAYLGMACDSPSLDEVRMLLEAWGWRVVRCPQGDGRDLVLILMGATGAEILEVLMGPEAPGFLDALEREIIALERMNEYMEGM